MYMTTGEVIRRIRKSIGMTQTELGGLLNFSQPAISGLERGGPASHDVRVLRLVARALQVPLAILVVESDEEADVDRRNFFRAGALGGAGAAMVAANVPAHAASSGIKVGASDVAQITDSINQIHELDLVVGGDRLCHLAAGQARYVQQLLDSGSYNEDTGKALATTTAEMMTAAGWVHYDAERRNAARRYYADAAQTSAAAGDGIATSHALLNASILDLDTDGLEGLPGRQPRPQDSVHLTQAAQDAARRSGGPKVRALTTLREAQALGAASDKPAMEKTLSRAHRAYTSGRGYDPDWVWLPEAEFNGLTGISYVGAGDYNQAVAYLQEAIAGTAQWPRERSVWQLELAHTHIKAGDAAHGCSLLTANFNSISAVGSARLQRKLDAIATAVRPHAAVAEVKQFLGMRATLT
ncbi:helix-turn-helix domain-containing protein [Nocardia vinacea]|uniref:Helix-turn-helix domain-containing protein n=1 Tax=Nocardia vinacea TaxID=96468 RepID=A0ABZ1YIX7_9NOCA|nr:helix-turn-helix domain-containing protein [Nocardia vinacea]